MARRQRVRCWTLAACAGSALAAANATTCSIAGYGLAERPSGLDVPCTLQQILSNITTAPQYIHSTWGLAVMDAETGKLLLDLNANKLFTTGSILKTTTQAAVLKQFGPNYRFNTTLHSQGNVTNGTLSGPLILRAAGDYSFGLRESAFNFNGSMEFASAPAVDHNYADTGLAGAVVPSGDPYAGMKKLVTQLKRANITSVQGDIVIDDRFYDAYNGWPNGLQSSIWLNENVLDITLSANGSSAGRLANLTYRPVQAAYNVTNNVTIVAAGTQTAPVTVVSPSNGEVVVSGAIAAESEPLVAIYMVPDPVTFARAGFVKTLNDAGISTPSAVANATNNATLLPAISTYSSGNTLATYSSAALSEFTKVILKVSYNRGSNAMACLLATAQNSTACTAGIAPIVETLATLGVSNKTIYPYDAAGSDERDRGSPLAFATLFRNITHQQTPWSQAFVRTILSDRGTVGRTDTKRSQFDSLSIVGVDGTEANQGANTSAIGNLRLKGGTRATATDAGQPLLTALTLGGYINATSGRRLTAMVGLNDFPFAAITDILDATAFQNTLLMIVRDSY